MDQERAGQQLKEFFRLTGELFLKALYQGSHLGLEGFQAYLMSRSQQPMTGQQDWDKFMASPDHKELKTFLSHELNVEQLTKYLKAYGIAFSLKEQDNGRTLLSFMAKDQALVTQVFDDLIKDLTSPDKGRRLNQKLLKTPKNMSLEEKIAYKKRVTREAIKLNKDKAIKAPRKGNREEVVKS